MSLPTQCKSFRLIVAIMRESPEAAYLLNAEGIVLYENPAGKRLLFETTDRHYDRQAGNPSHSYHFSFFWTFCSPSKPWQDFFDEIIQSDSPSSPLSWRRHCFDDNDDDAAFDKEYDVVCHRSNGTEFPGTLRLSKIGGCFCCEEPVMYLCAHVKTKAILPLPSLKQRAAQNPFDKKDNKLKAILNASFDPVCAIDEHGTILMVNPAFVRVFEWTEEEFLGSNVGIICGGEHGPRHNDYIRNYMDTGVRKIIGKRREVSAKRRDGSEFPVELGVEEVDCEEYGLPGRVIFCAFLKDLSVQKKYEHDMKHNMDLMQGMINASFDPMFQIDEKGEIQLVNDAAVALFGYRRDEMLGHNISIICGGGHAASHQKYMERYLKEGGKRVIGRKRQVTAKRKDGKEFEIELGVQEVESELGGKLFCGYVRDLTQQMLEKERMRKNEAAMKGQFFGSDKNGTKNSRNSDADLYTSLP